MASIPEVSKSTCTEECSFESAETALASEAEPSYHSRIFDNTEQPQHSRSPSSTVASPAVTNYSLGIYQTVAPASSFSSPRDFNRNPYTEIGYTPKRFRPDEQEEEDSPDYYEQLSSILSSSYTWMPPEYGSEAPIEQHSPTSPNQFLQSTNDYTGAVLHPGQLSSLTMYGYPGGAYSSRKKTEAITGKNAVEPRSPLLNANSPAQSKPPQRNLGMHNTAQQALKQEDIHNSMETSSTGTQSNFGVPLSESDKASSTFAIRARQAGIPDWNEQVVKGLNGNDSVFDGRWVLNPDEAWNVPARRTSPLAISPGSQRSNHPTLPFTNKDSEAPIRVGYMEGSKQWNQETHRPIKDQDSQIHFEASKLDVEPVQINQIRLRSEDRTSGKESSSGDLKGLVDSWQRLMMTDDVVEAREPRRLEQYVTDLSIANDGLRSKLESYNPASIRKVFYQRVFNNPEPQEPQGEDAKKLVKYKSEVLPYGELYMYLVEEINDLVAYMTTPVEHVTLQKAESRAGALDKRHQRLRTLLERDTVGEIAHRVGDLVKPHASDSQKRIQPLYSLQQQTKAHSSIEECRHASEVLEDMKSAESYSTRLPAHHGSIKSNDRCIQQNRDTARQTLDIEAGLTDKPNSIFASTHHRRLPGLVDPALGGEVVSNLARTPNLQYRPQSHFGDPATADFNPITAGYNSKFIEDQEEALSSQTPHQASSILSAQYPELSRSTLSSNVVVAPSGNAILPEIAETGYGATIPGQSLVNRAGLTHRHRRKLRSSSHESNVERSLLSTPFQITGSQPSPHDNVRYPAQPLLQTQAPAKDYTEARTQYQTDRPSRAQSLQGPNQHFPTQGPIFHDPGLRFNAGTTGFTPTHSSAAPFHTYGTQGQLLHIQQDLSRLLPNPYQQHLHQPLPQYHSFQPGLYGNVQRGSAPTDLVTGQPASYVPGMGFHTHLQYGAVPGFTNPSYVQPYIPADKYARAPAPNRLASRFAQANALKPVQSTINLNKSGPQSRFPTPAPSPRASLATLPYRSGSDDMFPYQRPGVASIRYQDLTREEPPRFAIAGDENYMPLIESTKLAKPAEWGVLKVSNVSLDGSV